MNTSPPLPPRWPPAAAGVGTVARHTGWNLVGQLLPVVVALVTVPLLIRLLGLERFGFLSVAWALVGYASLFDFGIGRALTRAVAQRLAGMPLTCSMGGPPGPGALLTARGVPRVPRRG